MKISEIFYSIQGEGTGIGTPSTFVRLSGCNLNCVWCDSQYHRHGEEMSIEKVFSAINASYMKNVVITGGEPLLQKAEVSLLANRLVSNDHHVEIETNGTIEPTNRLIELGAAGVDVLQFNVSPKLGSSGMRKYLNKNVLEKYNSKHINSFFKFVIADEKDYKETLQLIRELDLLENKIIFMPEGIEETKIMDHTKWLIEKVKKDELNYRVIPRLHILLYGNKRGK